MKTVNVILTSIALLALLIVNAEAGNKQVGGLIIGGGTGAIVGNAIGKNTESTLIGATVGGVLGLVIGNEFDKQHRPIVKHSQIVTYSTKYPNTHRSKKGNHRNKYKKNANKNYPSYHSYGETCKKIITVTKRHNKKKKVIRTSCHNNHRKHHKNRNRYRSNDRHSDRYYR